MSNKNKIEKKPESIGNTFIGNTPEIKINGVFYKMRRMSLADTFKLLRIIAIGASGIGKEITNLEINVESIIGILVVGFPYAERPIINFLSSLLGVTTEDLNNPEKFPMDSVLEIIDALRRHVDFQVFFKKLNGMLDNPQVKTYLKKISTSSKKDTVGQTKK